MKSCYQYKGHIYETDWVNIILAAIEDKELYKSNYSLMFFIAYTFKGQVHVFAGQVKIVSHSSCRTSEILKCFVPCNPMFGVHRYRRCCIKGHFRLMTILWSFSYNFFVKLCRKKWVPHPDRVIFKSVL